MDLFWDVEVGKGSGLNLYTAMVESFSLVLKRGSFCLHTHLFLVRQWLFFFFNLWDLWCLSAIRFRGRGGFFSHSSRMGTIKSGFHGFFWEKKAVNLLIPNHKVTFGAKRATFSCQKTVDLPWFFEKITFCLEFPNLCQRPCDRYFFLGLMRTKNRQIATSGWTNHLVDLAFRATDPMFFRNLGLLKTWIWTRRWLF